MLLATFGPTGAYKKLRKFISQHPCGTNLVRTCGKLKRKKSRRVVARALHRTYKMSRGGHNGLRLFRVKSG